MVLIFIVAIIPGWMTEQDPWQRVWAARDKRSAQIGMVMASMLIFVVFAACAVIAIGLNAVYPEIAEMGFPAGMALAEPALLNFINSNFSPLMIALSAIGLAAAAMTIASFFINSIIDAIHIATFIASASYFFPLMGGLFWKRATKEGALAGMVVGAVAQTALVVIDLANTPFMAPPYLATIHPALMGHGVIVGLSLGAVTFFGVSLLTAPSSVVNLAPFFKDEAEKLELHGVEKIDESDPEYKEFLGRIDEKVTGERTHLHLNITASKALDWNKTVEKLKESYPAWVTPAGPDSVYRLTHQGGVCQGPEKGAFYCLWRGFQCA